VNLSRKEEKIQSGFTFGPGWPYVTHQMAGKKKVVWVNPQLSLGRVGWAGGGGTSLDCLVGLLKA